MRLPVTISCALKRGSSSVLSLVWLLILVVPGGVIKLSFVVSLTFSPSVDLLVHEFSGELNGILHSFWLIAITTCHGMCRASHRPYSQLGLFLRETSITHLVQVLGNVSYSVLPWLAWAASRSFQ
ncbi:hypothetical protein Tco_0332312 [Tanacetum coccineum]